MAGVEEKEGQVGVVIRSHVGHDGSSVRTALESRVGGVKKSKELGQIRSRSTGYSIVDLTGAGGRRQHTPVSAVILSADGGLDRKDGVEDVVQSNHFLNTVGRQFLGASGVKGGDLGANERL